MVYTYLHLSLKSTKCRYIHIPVPWILWVILPWMARITVMNQMEYNIGISMLPNSKWFQMVNLLLNLLHPWRLTWNIIKEVCKIMFLSKWVICRFHVYIPGCNGWVHPFPFKRNHRSFKKPDQIEEKPLAFSNREREVCFVSRQWHIASMYGIRHLPYKFTKGR